MDYAFEREGRFLYYLFDGSDVKWLRRHAWDQEFLARLG
jgi:hypothetical protein